MTGRCFKGIISISIIFWIKIRGLDSSLSDWEAAKEDWRCGNDDSKVF